IELLAGDKPDLRQQGQSQDASGMLFDKPADVRVTRGKISSHLTLWIYFQRGANFARHGDGSLKQRELPLGLFVNPFRLWPGVFCERDGFCRRGLRQAVPQLFGEEWHKRMEQPQRSLKNREDVSPRCRGRLAIR